jgi:PucR C-terminal helix-turn-helix domain
VSDHTKRVDPLIGTTIRQLVDAVGTPTLRVLVAPAGLDRQVRTTVQYDPIDALVDEPDAVLLLVGTKADSQTALEVVRAASQLGYCAVVVKRRDEDIRALITEASVHAIAVLAVADEVSWRHLDSLLLAEIGSQGVTFESGSGSGDELFSLANSIAASTGGSVAIEDLDRRVLAYSSLPGQRIDSLREQSILERRVPQMERNSLQYRAVLATEGIVRFPEKSDEFARSSIAIRAGSQPLGTIWAIETLDGLNVAAQQSLVEGAQLAASQILRNTNASDQTHHLRETALLRALDGSLSGSETAYRLALPPGVELGLVGFGVIGFETLSDQENRTPLITHLASVIGGFVAAYRPDGAIATTTRSVYVLLPGVGTAAMNRFAAGALTASHGVFPNQVRVAIARTTTDPADLAALRYEVDDILRVTTSQEDLPETARLGDVHTRVLLAHVADELVHSPRLRHPKIDAMHTYDIEHQTEYAASVSAWLDAIGGIAEAAEKLSIHPNTLRYRLRRVHELFDIALVHPDDRLSVWMQLRLTSR